MRSAIYYTVFFVLAVITVTSSSGCGGGVTADTPNANKPIAVYTDKPKVNSADYPPLTSELADAEFELIDGTKMKISDRKGKVVFLNLWATWCGPCRAEMPHLIEMQNKYGDKGFQVIGLDIGNDDLSPESVDDIKSFAQKMKLNYELARIPPEMTNKFNSISRLDGVPQSFLIDREGRLRGVFVGGGSKVINTFKETVDKVMAE